MIALDCHRNNFPKIDADPLRRFQSPIPCEGSETYARDRGSYFVYDPLKQYSEILFL